MTDLATIETSWDQAAREDAMWNILTDPERKNGLWTAEDFFEHGRTEIERAVEHIDSLGLGDRPTTRALDFGCGVGRLTQALGEWYGRVDGVDVSNEMIRQALDHQPSEWCHFHHNTAPNLKLFRAGTFDFVYSMIVLQHMPQELQQGYVREFFRVLKRRGVAMFEIPDGPDSGHPGWWLSMYGVPRATVARWIEDGGGKLVDVEDLGHDAGWQNYRYTAVPA